MKHLLVTYAYFHQLSDAKRVSRVLYSEKPHLIAGERVTKGRNTAEKTAEGGIWNGAHIFLVGKRPGWKKRILSYDKFERYKNLFSFCIRMHPSPWLASSPLVSLLLSLSLSEYTELTSSDQREIQAEWTLKAESPTSPRNAITTRLEYLESNKGVFSCKKAKYHWDKH